MGSRSAGHRGAGATLNSLVCISLIEKVATKERLEGVGVSEREKPVQSP